MRRGLKMSKTNDKTILTITENGYKVDPRMKAFSGMMCFSIEDWYNFFKYLDENDENICAKHFLTEEKLEIFNQIYKDISNEYLK